MLASTGLVLLMCLTLTAAAEDDSFVGDPSSPRACYKCSGVTCQLVSRKNYVVQCNDVMDVCVTVFDGFRVSERGCLFELSLASQSICNAKDIQCQKCSGDVCNTKGRNDYLCMECNSSEDTRCHNPVNKLTPKHCDAPTANNGYCYVRFNNTGLTRGCATSATEQKSCLEDRTCSLCSPEDVPACNTYHLLRSGAAKATLHTVLGVLVSVFSMLTVQMLN